ncbi:hypothetical protein [Actinomadura sp. NAK00032]|uniref:hypothetical protein n=1 Tax=Actinomadura sp. NAK00032 TaxID=2742128 RepID=UPI001C379CA9|nr:hypothetical protein [Actinomadura sp. NAK00032]
MFDYSAHEGAPDTADRLQTPTALRRHGPARLEAWLRKRAVRNAGQVAATALETAHAQYTALPGQAVAAQIAADLPTQLLALEDRLKRLDAQITKAFRSHPRAEIIESMPGIGPGPGHRVRRRRR